MWERISWSRKQHSLNSLKWNTRTEILQYVAVWSADLINCGETCGRTEDAATGCFPFLYCWLFCGLLCLRPAFLYWGGIHRVASAVCAIWEQSIAHTDGRLLTGISLVGGWLQGWHQQVKSSLVQSNILCSNSCHSCWLHGGGTGDVSLVRNFDLQIVTPSDLWKTTKVTFAFCMWQEALCPLCTQDFWPWVLLQCRLLSYLDPPLPST